MPDARSLQEEVIAQGGQFVCVPDVNHDECRQRLLSLQVDLLVLTGTPIVRAPILAVPRIGVLNAHQGALPEFRGMNVIEWAVLEGHQPALSIHFVNAGVDAGDLIVSESVAVAPGDSLSSLRLRSGQRQVELLADTVLAALSGPLPRQSQRGEDGRQFYLMHPRVRRIAEQRLQVWHVCPPAIPSANPQQKAHLQ
jgi:methionyl-tRNA formyltransferase